MKWNRLLICHFEMYTENYNNKRKYQKSVFSHQKSAIVCYFMFCNFWCETTVIFMMIMSHCLFARKKRQTSIGASAFCYIIIKKKKFSRFMSSTWRTIKSHSIMWFVDGFMFWKVNLNFRFSFILWQHGSEMWSIMYTEIHMIDIHVYGMS